MTVYYLVPNGHKTPYNWTNYLYSNINTINGVPCVSTKSGDANQHQAWDMTSVSLLAGEEIGTLYIFPYLRQTYSDAGTAIYCKAYFGFEGWLAQKGVGTIGTSYGYKATSNWTNLHIQTADIGAAILSLCTSGMTTGGNQVDVDYCRIVMTSTNGIPAQVSSLTHLYTPATHVARFTRGTAAPCRSGIYKWDVYNNGSWTNDYYVGTASYIEFVVGNGIQYDCRVRAVNGEFISATYKYAASNPFTQSWTNIGEVNGIPYANIGEINGITKANIGEFNGIE